MHAWGIAGGTELIQSLDDSLAQQLAFDFESGPGEPFKDVHGLPGTSTDIQQTSQDSVSNLLSRPPMLQGHPRTSSCSRNFFGVRSGVSEIAYSAYPTLEILCKLRGLRDGCVAHSVSYSNPGLGFELV